MVTGEWVGGSEGEGVKCGSEIDWRLRGHGKSSAIEMTLVYELELHTFWRWVLDN